MSLTDEYSLAQVIYLLVIVAVCVIPARTQSARQDPASEDHQTSANLARTPDVSPGFARPEMQRISDDVYIAQLSKNLWVHTTVGVLADGSLYAANGVLLEDGSNSILFDVGWTSEQARVLVDWARTVLLHPIAKAYVTHFHNDRLGGAEELKREHIPVFGTKLTVMLARDSNQPVPDHTIATPLKSTRVAGDAVILFPGAGHTRDNIIVDFPREKILFGGCFLKAGNAAGIGNTADADLKAWPVSLERLRSVFPDTRLQIPGHGPISAEAIQRTMELLSDQAQAGR